MYLYKENGKYYVQKSKKETTEKTVISKEVFDLCRHSNWNETKRQSREKICRDGKGVRCKNDCGKCPWHKTGGPLSLEQLEANGVEPVGFPSAEDYVIQQETNQELYAAIGTLEEENRDIITLYYFEEFTEKSIGEMLGMGQKTVNNHKHGSLKKIRNFLAKNQ